MFEYTFQTQFSWKLSLLLSTKILFHAYFSIRNHVMHASACYSAGSCIHIYVRVCVSVSLKKAKVAQKYERNRKLLQISGRKRSNIQMED